MEIVDYSGMHNSMGALVAERKSLQLAREKIGSVISVREFLEADLWSAFKMPETGNERITSNDSSEVHAIADTLGSMYESIQDAVDNIAIALEMLEEATTSYESLKNMGREMNVRAIWLEFILNGSSAGKSESFWEFIARASSPLGQAIGNASAVHTAATNAPNKNISELRSADVLNKLTLQKEEIEGISTRVKKARTDLMEWDDENPIH